ncbi:MAG: PEGA domain-containing protein [Bradymonadia bacterium]
MMIGRLALGGLLWAFTCSTALAQSEAQVKDQEAAPKAPSPALAKADLKGRPVGLAVRETVKPVTDGDREAFLNGARLALGVAPGLEGQALRDPLTTPARRRRMADAQSALEKGQQAYLDLYLGAAERHLSTAVERLMEDPSALAEAGVAIQATLLLAQVRLTQQRVSEADRILTRGVLAFPNFPGPAHPPPPEVAVRLKGMMTRMAPDLTGGLKVESTPPGLQVHVNGVSIGETPATVSNLPARPFRIRVSRDGVLVGTRLVEPLEGGMRAVRFDIGGATARAATLAELQGLRRESEVWPGLQAFAAAVEAEEVCVAVAEGADVHVVRLSPTRRRIIGGHRRPVPDSTAAWQALGRLCAPEIPSILTVEQVQKGLWGEALTEGPQGQGPEADGTRSVWGWSAVGAGAAAGVVGVIFGVQALQSQDDFESAGSPALADDAADRAQRQALLGDVAYTLSAGLVATGIYLLLTDR